MCRFESSRLQRVLVVDDHAASRRHTLAALRQLGCSVKAARGLDEAIVRAVDWKPTVVLTDWNLGPDNGHDVLAAIRRYWPGPEPEPRFALMSGSPPDARLLPDDGGGFSAVLAKPVRPDILARELGLSDGELTGCSEDTQDMAELFRQELTDELRQLESLILEGQLRQAADLAHRMIAGSALAGARRLETALRALDALLRGTSDAGRVAGAWCEMRREAFDFLDGVPPIQAA